MKYLEVKMEVKKDEIDASDFISEVIKAQGDLGKQKCSDQRFKN